MQFQQDCPKDKKYSSFNFLAENLEKFRSTELYGAAIEGSTIFLCRSSLGCTSMESYQLADLKYAIFSRIGCNRKKLPRSKLFMKGIRLLIMKKGIWLLIRKGIGLLISKGIGLFIMKGIG